MSKIMRVIEIEDNCDGMSLEEALHDLNDCVFPVIGGKSVAFAIEILRALTHGTPIDKGDLIMFDLLMTTIADKELPFEEVLLLIDNAKTPYNPTGDLISREALKEHKVYSEERHEYVVPVYNIDNAQPVDAIVNTIEVRTKGEWIPMNPDCRGYSDYFKCSICGAYIYPNIPEKELDYNGCPYCFADMRKGGAE